jgi:hypothetical protein
MAPPAPVVPAVVARDELVEVYEPQAAAMSTKPSAAPPRATRLAASS